MTLISSEILNVLRRIADSLESLEQHFTSADSAMPTVVLDAACAFLWKPAENKLDPVRHVNKVDLGLLKGIERQCATLLENTRRFAQGLPANNALLWGARGTGKSSLVKAVHAALILEAPKSLILVEINREDIPTLPHLLSILRNTKARFLLYCDDLSFEAEDVAYKSLKAVLDGGIEGRPDNVIFYATSNRRHLMARSMIENETATAIHPGEAIEEKVSLSDRFGLWLGFHNIDQETYHSMIRAYVSHYQLPINDADAIADANEWSITRGARSGRVAWQFIQDLAGRLNIKL